MKKTIKAVTPTIIPIVETMIDCLYCLDEAKIHAGIEQHKPPVQKATTAQIQAKMTKPLAWSS